MQDWVHSSMLKRFIDWTQDQVNAVIHGAAPIEKDLGPLLLHCPTRSGRDMLLAAASVSLESLSMGPEETEESQNEADAEWEAEEYKQKSTHIKNRTQSTEENEESCDEIDEEVGSDDDLAQMVVTLKLENFSQLCRQRRKASNQISLLE